MTAGSPRNGTENERDGPRRIKSVCTAATVIDVIKQQQGGSLTDISQELELTKGTVHTYLQTLVDCGFVTRENGEYRLSFQFIALGEHVRNETDLYMAGHSEVDALAERTGEYAHLIGEERGRETVLYESRGEFAVAMDYHLRMRETPQHLHDTAAGKAILAHVPTDRRDEIIANQEFERQTANTITDAAELRETLADIRERGYAVNDEEEIRGMRAVGAPVLGPDETVVGAVSVTAPTSRLKDERFRTEMPEQVMETANLIEVNLETARFDS
ncbi:IclR family transcriptional regulator [Natrialba chahannaoensis JCM 10990]|uniref:IclR family transcriptional regulator n=1 Tax=Natrialba chahannaoensis JCM 10990 TaxID=1227492 RepID=M0AGL7_9EURY|nr:IclR family transcriptional regulator [Natrialba chahannaoensis]ELY96503.1 IclR family transcriptional regulator [Natrialba chahannaoensis JCM 10990]